MIQFLLFFTTLVVSALAASNDNSLAWSPPFYPAPVGGRLQSDWSSAYGKARDFVSQLTIMEKVNLTSGTGWQMDFCVGNTGTIPRLNFSSLCLQDGPLGVRKTDYITAFPAGITVGATFNRGLMLTRGQALGYQHKQKGVDIVLGPAMGPLGRNAAGGRIWEGFGADPYLQGIGAALTVQGIQSQGVVATAKHYIGNEQEYFRQHLEWVGYGFLNLKEPLSSNIDDRTLHEVYLWPFADAVHAGVGSIMCSYNRVNNSQACQNSYLLNGLLKSELGFEGFVMSDWLAQRSGVASVLAGMDMTMPGDGLNWADGQSLLGPELTTMILNGTVPEDRLDDMVTRIMAAYFYVGLDQTRKQISGPNFSSWALNDYLPQYFGAGEGQYILSNQHVDSRNQLSESVSKQIAVEAISLLKNNGALPLNPSAGALTGQVQQPRQTAKIRRIAIVGKGAGPDPAGVNCEADLACSNGALAGGWGSGAAPLPFLITPLEGISKRARDSSIMVDWAMASDDLDTIDPIASIADAAIVFALTDSGEGFVAFDGNIGDRKNTSLWHNADDVILRTASVNKNTIVVISSVGPVNMEKWIDHPNVSAVLFTPPASQYAGDAIASVLFGDANPSGRLPFTIAKNDSDYIPIVRTVPGNGLPQAEFSEGLYIDYRYFEKHNIEPRFEFGYGLSYSKFNISGLEIIEVHSPSITLPPPPASLNEEVNVRPKTQLSSNTKYAGTPTENFFGTSNLEEDEDEDESEYDDDDDREDSLPVIPSDVVFPSRWHKVRKFIYPYVSSTKVLEPQGNYPYPEGYSVHQKPIPLAGGAPGGNPALWQVAYRIHTTLSNLGPYTGSYVVQLYVGFPTTAGFESPKKQLRGFQKFALNPGQSIDVELDLLTRDLAVWDVVTASWIVQRGQYHVYIGSSSRIAEVVGSFTIE